MLVLIQSNKILIKLSELPEETHRWQLMGHFRTVSLLGRFKACRIYFSADDANDPAQKLRIQSVLDGC